ncbi:hypothetical protein E7T06_07610 [Deinococcus sp. Arct2-2]|uniref:hypothetical protein n=1 Tax=Deinococcus sp. Arct2-2 TaxID=2568653 RepID=UPI0010A40380|nr:hypothetical protein [Deinococcus sp. Arct2-2]THF70330.1 hypothetical protein E7T06_07610 [Deinococcus sp. Arct2-2]
MGYSAGLALTALAVGVYFAPRPLPEADVAMWCEREAYKQSRNKLDFSTSDLSQQGYTATFKINSLDGRTSVAARCTVSGTSKDLQVDIEMER